MNSTTVNGRASSIEEGDTAGADARLVQQVLTPDDVVPRLVGLGVPPERAQRLAGHHGERRIADALDALEVLDADRRILDPVGWVDAAVQQRWDLTAVLAERREREQRLSAIDAERQRRETAADAYPAWRAIADRWDRAVSAALDDEQLGRAIDLLTTEVPGLGRRSVPIVRAELIAWAVDVHERVHSVPLADALAEDLTTGPQPPAPRDWPLPDPPAIRNDDVRPLVDRVGEAIGEELVREFDGAVAISVPQRTVRFGEDLER